MAVVMTTGATSHAKLQSNRRHWQTNTQFFTRPDALPVTQPEVLKHWRELQLSLKFWWHHEQRPSKMLLYCRKVLYFSLPTRHWIDFLVFLLLTGQSGMSCCAWSGHSRSSRRSPLYGRSAKEWSSRWLTSRHLAMLRLSHFFHRIKILLIITRCVD